MAQRKYTPVLDELRNKGICKIAVKLCDVTVVSNQVSKEKMELTKRNPEGPFKHKRLSIEHSRIPDAQVVDGKDVLITFVLVADTSVNAI
jgi:hypothetical protein